MSTRNKADAVAEELATEYDFASLRKPVRGKYSSPMKECSNLVLLDSDVPGAFLTTESVNDALRSLLAIA